MSTTWRLQPLYDSFLVAPALAATDTSLYLFGGVEAAATSAAASAQLWELDLASGRWLSHPTADAPRATSGHSLVALRGRLYLLGARRTTPAGAAATAPAVLLPPADEEEGEGAVTPTLWSIAQPTTSVFW